MARLSRLAALDAISLEKYRALIWGIGQQVGVMRTEIEIERIEPALDELAPRVTSPARR